MIPFMVLKAQIPLHELASPVTFHGEDADRFVQAINQPASDRQREVLEAAKGVFHETRTDKTANDLFS